MRRDPRYKKIANQFATGKISSFRDIFDTLPKTVVKVDMGMHHLTFSKRLNHPETFTLKEMVQLASLIGVSEMVLIDLIYKQYVADLSVTPKK